MIKELLLEQKDASRIVFDLFGRWKIDASNAWNDALSSFVFVIESNFCMSGLAAVHTVGMNNMC